jgi:hypothetical protein
LRTRFCFKNNARRVLRSPSARASTNPLEVEDRLNLDLQVLDNWAKQWLVDFNPQKTEYMVISFRQNINPINLKFNSESLNQFIFYLNYSCLI